MTPEVIKVCSCGEEYTRDRWGMLHYCGQQDDGVEVYELRLCAVCQSTIAVAVGVKEGGECA